jgi:membrane protein required for colicin V production
MNVFDIFLLGVIAVSGLSGIRTGFTRVVVHLAASIVGLLAAFWCYGIVAAQLHPWIGQPLAAQVIGFCLIFFGTMLLGSLCGMVLVRFFDLIGLGWLDHLLGAAAGLLRGALLVAMIAAVVVAFTPQPTPAFLSESQVLPYATNASGLIAEFAPKHLRDDFLDQMFKLKQMWLKSSSKEKRSA